MLESEYKVLFLLREQIPCKLTTNEMAIRVKGLFHKRHKEGTKSHKVQQFSLRKL